MWLLSHILFISHARFFPLKRLIHATNWFETRNLNSRWHHGFFFVDLSVWLLWCQRTLKLICITLVPLVCWWVFSNTLYTIVGLHVFSEVLMRPLRSVLLHEAVYRCTFAVLPLLIWFTSYLKLPHLLNIIPVQWLWNQVLTSCLIKIKMILCLTRKKTGAHKLGSDLLIKSELLPFFLFVCLLLI